MTIDQPTKVHKNNWLIRIEALYVASGREVTAGVRCDLTDLARRYSAQAVYNALRIAELNGVANISYITELLRRGVNTQTPISARWQTAQTTFGDTPRQNWRMRP